MRQHPQMNTGILVSRKSDRAYLALLLGLQQRLRRAARSKDQVRIVFVDHLMDLPQVQMVGLQPPQRLFQLPHGNVFAAPMSADLGHHHSVLPLAFERCAHNFFTVPIVIIPGIVEEVDSRIHRNRDNLVGVFLIFRRAQVIAT